MRYMTVKSYAILRIKFDGQIGSESKSPKFVKIRHNC